MSVNVGFSTDKTVQEYMLLLFVLYVLFNMNLWCDDKSGLFAFQRKKQTFSFKKIFVTV